jgi:hypothetical protein
MNMKSITDFLGNRFWRNALPGPLFGFSVVMVFVDASMWVNGIGLALCFGAFSWRSTQYYNALGRAELADNLYASITKAMEKDVDDLVAELRKQN